MNNGNIANICTRLEDGQSLNQDMLKSITDANLDIESTLPLYSDSDANVLHEIEGYSFDMLMLSDEEEKFFNDFFEFDDINDDLNSSLNIDLGESSSIENVNDDG